MASDLAQYRVQSGERSNYAKMDGLINTVQGSLRGIGDQSKNAWGSGLILAPSQLSSGGAVAGSVIPGDYASAILADSPRGYWKFDEASGTLADSSGNGHTGTPNGGITYGVAGAVNTAIRLDGTSGYVSVPDHADFDLGDVLTLEAWVNPTAFPDFMIVFDKGNSAYRLSISPAGKFRLEKVGTGVIVASTIPIPLDGFFHQIVATKNAGTVKLYLDTNDVTGTVTNQVLGDNGTQMGIGAQLDGTPAAKFFKGGLDEAAIYATALSQARVIAHYQARGTPVSPQTLIWNGTSWAPTGVRQHTIYSTTSTVDIVNDATQKDLFTGNLATAGSAGFTIPPVTAGSVARIVAGGDFLNNSGAGRKITLGLGLTSGGVFTQMWGDLSVNIAVAATRRAWRLRAAFQYNGSSADRVSGVFAMADSTAALTGLGKLRDSTRPALYAPFTSIDPAVNPSGKRLVLALTQELADPNLSMRTLFARVEVTI
ncbi:MAG TPA: LamG domain-containing protein [Actinomycetota bacterium]|nr:LamG domain-containing protein [Actinomycetota bacterium]